MKKIFLVILLMGIALCRAAAQQDAKAESILNKMAENYQKAGGISLSFGGTQSGTLLLKGNKFYLESGGIQTWFDGKTQWSYVEQNEEVNVSTPTPEELQSVNPYALVTTYKKSFNYRYVGEKTISRTYPPIIHKERKVHREQIIFAARDFFCSGTCIDNLILSVCTCSSWGCQRWRRCWLECRCKLSH